MKHIRLRRPTNFKKNMRNNVTKEDINNSHFRLRTETLRGKISRDKKVIFGFLVYAKIKLSNVQIYFVSA